MNHLYEGHLTGILQLLRRINEAEKSCPDEPNTIYMQGPIEWVLDGEEFGCRFRNDIGDEWCLEID